MRNRIPSGKPQKVLVIQTPAGAVHVPIGDTTGMPEPVARAFRIFENAIDRGADDPFGETMQQLQEMAQQGDDQPLSASITYINNLVAEAMKSGIKNDEGVLTRLEKPQNLN